jgi:hypothetical protein
LGPLGKGIGGESAGGTGEAAHPLNRRYKKTAQSNLIGFSLL